MVSLDAKAIVDEVCRQCSFNEECPVTRDQDEEYTFVIDEDNMVKCLVEERVAKEIEFLAEEKYERKQEEKYL